MARRAVVWFASLVFVLTFTPLTACAQQTEAATRQYAAASGFQNQKLFDAAIDEWQTFVRKFPDDPRIARARHYLGTCCLQEKRYKDAVAALAVVVDRHSDFELADQSALNLGIARYGLAQKSKSKRDFATAERAFGDMLAKFPNSTFAARALYYRGECLFEQGKTKQAATQYARLIDRYPKHETIADAIYALGTALESLKKPDDAQAMYGEFATKFPNHELVTEVRMRQAELLFNAKKFRDALPVFAAVSRKSGFELADVAMLRQARCVYELGEPVKAAKMYWDVPRRFRQTKHYDAAILAGAKCYFMEGDYRRARGGLEQIAKRSKPEAAEATQWLARCHLKEGNAQQAMEVADSGLKRFRNDPQRPAIEMARLDAMYEIKSQKPRVAALYSRFAKANVDHELAPQAQYMAALAALETEEYDDAAKYAERFLDRHEDSGLRPDVLFISAESKLLQGEHKLAARRYREFLRLAPKHENAAQAKVRLGLAMHLADDHEGAVSWLKQVAGSVRDSALRSEAFSVLGRSLIEQKQFEQAASMLQQSITAAPNRKGNDETMLALADAYRRAGKDDEAARQMQQVMTKYPDSKLLDEAQYRLGEAAYEAENYKDAIRHYADLIDRFPRSEFAPHAQYGLGWSYFNTGQFRDASAAMTKLLSRYGDSKVAGKAYYVRAMASYELGEFNDVARDVTAFMQTKPKRNDALDAQYVRGLALAGKKQFSDAARVFASILAEGDGYEGADKVAYELGWTYTELKQTDKAAATFRKLAQDYPDSELAGESLFRIAESYYDANAFDRAAEAYAESASKTKNAEIGEKSLHKLGWSRLKSKDNGSAAEAFQMQLRKYPRGELAGDARFLIGECSFREKQWQPALAAYQAVIRSRDSNYLALATFRAGECAGSLEDWRTSRAMHEQVLANHPQFEMKPEAIYGLAWALQNQGRLDDAVKLYEQVTEQTQTETAAKARFMIGECCFAQKKHKEATRHFLKAAFTYNHKEWSPASYFEAGRCFEVLRDTKQAQHCYQQVITKFPKHAKAKSAQARLRKLGS